MEALRPQANSSDDPAPVVINLARLAQLGILTPDGARSHAAEAFRLIKRRLLARACAVTAAPAAPANLVLLTSALPGEGKTFCSVNLAVSLAMERDHTVLLVDADVARPAISALLGLQRTPGLLDLLGEPGRKPSALILRTNIAGLSLLSAGQAHPHAAEMLASQAMRSLLAELASEAPARIVIFDSPPILLSSEAAVLAGQMGQVLLVVASDVTSRRAVTEALRRLDHCAPIDLICNKARAFAGQAYDSDDD
ncbi:XrtA-associated tyrosine autokinase [Massilia sp. CF038]|uniref:XrtA-associated tyrosine autokinase n=1 Tax=Massilia sp. CF038 TaxID=1881045 RepID=UPI00091420AB|nr:XrtA-associated tyrosine autokinase [Massilia sp. CF038]SHG74932.1 exopolysaccharide/PEP-CTERM locus tyrosine autokinase [Massilia sp. CF038]